MATIRDVAKQAGVSIASVSRAFHADPKLRAQTRDMILQAARDIGYTPVSTPRIALPAHTHSIGIIMYDIDNPWYMLVARRMEKQLRQENGNLVILFDDDMRAHEEDCLRRLAAAGVEGIMFHPLSADHMPTVNALRARGVSFLQLYTQLYPDISSVMIDDHYGALTAMRRLFFAGYRRVMCLGPGNFDVYRRAHQEIGQIPDPSLCIDTFQYEDPYDAICEAIARHKPDAIVSWADKTSRCVIRALREMKLSWPEDIGLIVYDDLPWVSLLNITAIAQPIDVIADTAVQHMLHIIRNHDDRGLAASSIKPFLIERGSVGAGPANR